MAHLFSGRCLCGAVTYTCSGEPLMAGHCHCEDCRRSSGTGHASHLAVPEATFQAAGITTQYDRPAGSGNMVERFFCPTCGSVVFSRNAGMPGMMFIRASSLDDPEVFKPQMHVFTSRAASWDPPGGGLPAFETMPPGM